jgi:hypothetical protein
MKYFLILKETFYISSDKRLFSEIEETFPVSDEPKWNNWIKDLKGLNNIFWTPVVMDMVSVRISD